MLFFRQQHRFKGDLSRRTAFLLVCALLLSLGGLWTIVPSGGTAKASTALGPLVTAINAGGNATGSFVADTGYDTGNTYSDTSSSINTSSVSNPAPQAVWQTCRWNSSFTYTIPGLAAGASYVVQLDWAELTWQAAGQRLFNVAINGTSALSNFDVYAQAGYKTALTKQFSVTATGSGQIVIAFTKGSVDNPFISGIEIYQPLPVTPTATTTPGGLVTAINAGGNANGSFVADTDYDTGNTYSDTSTTINTSGMSNPAPQAVWQSCRWNSSFTYTIPGLTAGRSYLVALDWAELTWQAAGQRVFNVAMNGTSVLSHFDVYAQVGYKTALQKQFLVVANSSGQIVIAFTQAGADNPFISGIEIYQPSSVTPTPTPTTGITPTPAATPIPPSGVGVWLTTTDGNNLLTQQQSLNFAAGNGTASSTINVNDYQQFQQIVGFGSAMTDSSAYLIGTRMSASQRAALMQALFSPTNGIGVSFVRIPMGSSDFTATPISNPAPYSYDDLPTGQTDPNLAQFSLNHDMAYIIPTLQQVLQTNPQVVFLANPWSPPAWMKTNGSMLGSVNGQRGMLISSDYGPLAQYFVKFLQGYQAQGIPISYITPQNEPYSAPDSFPGMYLAPGDEANFIANDLGPSLASAGLSPKILAWDYNWDTPSYPLTVLSNATANSYIAGVGWHAYGGNPSAMSNLHNAYPNKGEYETEFSTGSANDAVDLALHSVQNWAKTVELWNIALDPNGGPKMGQGCIGCIGLVTIDPSTGNYTFTGNYYGLGQVSKFVMPGAYHIGSSALNAGLNNAAFLNPDGSKVLVVHNTSTSSIAFNVSWDNTQSFSYTLPASGIVTFKWSGTAPQLSAGLSINVGGSAAGAFVADTSYNGGTTASTTANIDTSGVSNPAPQAVYQSYRYGNFTYTETNLIPGAQYTLRLQFAETFWNSSGQRLFNATINGQQVLTNFDVYATAGGANKAIAESFSVTADSNGQIMVQLSSVRDNAELNGIDIHLANLAINAGGTATGSFITDQFASGGFGYSTSASINTSGVSNPAPQAVYQTERYGGDVVYTIPTLTPGKTYTIRLHFAENYWTSSGQRVFNVVINGQQVLTNFDIYATAGGANKALVEQFTTTADTSGQVTIDLTAVVDNAKIDGIEVVAS